MAAIYVLVAEENTSPSEDDKDSGGIPMLVTAFVSNLPVASLTLDFENEEDTSSKSSYGTDYRANAGVPVLRLEIDNKNPPRLVENPYSPSALSASCKYRIYPSLSGCSITTTTGSSRLSESGLIMPVKETLVFSNSGTANLRYKPAGLVTITPIGDFVDQWGNKFSPNLVPPGGTVETVQWINSNTYSDPKPRELNEYEVGATNPFSKLIACWGLVSVEYSTTYDLHEFIFDKEPVQGNDAMVQFKDTYVFAIYSNKVAGQLQIQAPPTKGKK